MAITLVSGPAKQALASESIAAGQAVRLENGQLALVDITDTVEKSSCEGIALTQTVANEQGVYAANGAVVNFGVGLTQGATYCVSAAAGLAERSTLITGQWITHLGVANDSNELPLNILASKTQVP